MNGYIILNDLLNEMSAMQVMKHGGKRIFKNVKKDPYSAALVAIPAPGSAPAGVALHFAKNKGSRNTAGAMIKKAMNPNRLKAGQRAAAKVKADKAADFKKYMKVSGTLS